MRRHPALSRSGLRKVTVLVPEGCAEALRQVASELRIRREAGTTEPAPRWQTISPSAELMVCPEHSARGAIRDTKAPGGKRFRWTVRVLGQLDPIAKGRTGSRAEARLQAEMTVATYFSDGREPPGDGRGDG